MSNVETIAQAKDRLMDDIVTYQPTGETTNVQWWEEENGEAFAIVSLAGLGPRRVPSVDLVEFGYEDALAVLARPRR